MTLDDVVKADGTVDQAMLVARVQRAQEACTMVRS